MTDWTCSIFWIKEAFSLGLSVFFSENGYLTFYGGWSERFVRSLPILA